MNALLLFLVRRDCSLQLAAHLAAGIAALWLFFGTSRNNQAAENARPVHPVATVVSASR